MTVGPLCGYLLAGGVWANLYALTAVLVPRSFNADPAVAGQLANWHGRRALFDIFSLSTLPSMGYDAVTPIAPPATTLAVLEALFGLYIAVVVAQLVGIRLAQEFDRDGARPT